MSLAITVLTYNNNELLFSTLRHLVENTNFNFTQDEILCHFINGFFDSSCMSYFIDNKIPITESGFSG